MNTTVVYFILNMKLAVVQRIPFMQSGYILVVLLKLDSASDIYLAGIDFLGQLFLILSDCI